MRVPEGAFRKKGVPRRLGPIMPELDVRLRPGRVGGWKGEEGVHGVGVGVDPKGWTGRK